MTSATEYNVSSPGAPILAGSSIIYLGDDWSPTPAIEQFRDYVRIASSWEEFLRGSDRVLAPDAESHKIPRISSVADMSWDRRTEEVLAVVEQRLSEVINASCR